MVYLDDRIECRYEPGAPARTEYVQADRYDEYLTAVHVPAIAGRWVCEITDYIGNLVRIGYGATEEEARENAGQAPDRGEEE